MSRVKRMERKLAYLDKHFKNMSTDDIMGFIRKFALAPDKMTAEMVLDDYVDKTHHTFITRHNIHLIDPQQIDYVQLNRDAQGEPVTKIKQGNRYFYFPLSTGHEIYVCNEFLRSLNVGVNIHYKNYSQYGEMLFEITKCLINRK